MNTHTSDSLSDRLHARRAELVQRQQQVALDRERRKDPLVNDAPDRAIQLQNDDALQAIDENALQEIAAIDVALTRLSLNQYGICKDCGNSISKARLDAVPHAVTCIKCAIK